MTIRQLLSALSFPIFMGFHRIVEQESLRNVKW